MVNRFAVIGNPIAHSLSPIIHQHFAKDAHVQLTYEKILGDEVRFEQQVSAFFGQDGRGMNVTLPFKQRAFTLAAKSTPRCNLVGVANTLWIEGHQLHADNTDGVGLVRDLTRYIEVSGARLLILGAGGAARGVISALLEEKPGELTVANRSLSKLAELQKQHPQIGCVDLKQLSGAFDIIINATSASLENKILTLPDSMMMQKPFCYDLAYNQKEDTSFVQYAKSWGCAAQDGLGMLVEQAAEAFFIWHGVRPSLKSLSTISLRDSNSL